MNSASSRAGDSPHLSRNTVHFRRLPRARLPARRVVGLGHVVVGAGAGFTHATVQSCLPAICTGCRGPRPLCHEGFITVNEPHAVHSVFVPTFVVTSGPRPLAHAFFVTVSVTTLASVQTRPEGCAAGVAASAFGLPSDCQYCGPGPASARGAVKPKTRARAAPDPRALMIVREVFMSFRFGDCRT